MKYMFDGCNSLTIIDLSNFNIEKVLDMTGMFSKYNSLIEIDFLLMHNLHDLI